MFSLKTILRDLICATCVKLVFIRCEPAAALYGEDHEAGLCLGACRVTPFAVVVVRADTQLPILVLVILYVSSQFLPSDVFSTGIAVIFLPLNFVLSIFSLKMTSGRVQISRSILKVPSSTETHQTLWV